MAGGSIYARYLNTLGQLVWFGCQRVSTVVKSAVTMSRATPWAVTPKSDGCGHVMTDCVISKKDQFNSVIYNISLRNKGECFSAACGLQLPSYRSHSIESVVNCNGKTTTVKKAKGMDP